MLAFFDDPTLYPGGHQELFATFSLVTMQFLLDGVPLEMEQTSIRQFPQPPPEFSENPLMATTFGAFLPPGSLALGSHTLRTISFDPIFGHDDFTVTFSAIEC